MNRATVGTAIIAASLALSPTSPAVAGGGDLLGGLIVGGIVGAAIANDANKKKRVVKRAAPVVSNGVREDNRMVQTALNYFGFNTGTPDGSLGPKSRAAISQMQMTLGYPATGQLTQFEHDFLLLSYNRAQAGGANTLAMIARDPQGAAGLLIAWRDELSGGGAPAGALPGAVEAAAPAAPAADGGAVAPPLAVPAPTAPVLPAFAGLGVAAQPSLTSHCNQVSLVTGTNGGYATLASLSDPDQALNEQFCLARTYAISTGEVLEAQITGVAPTDVTEQCKAFGPVMAGPVASLGVRQPADVLASVGPVIVATGIAPAQLAATARICLSVGYRTDDMGVAIGSALLLAGLGEGAYDELLGHHLMRGFGVAANPALAKAWFKLGLDAIDAGQPAVFAPGQPERAELIRAVVFGARPLPPVVPAAEMVPAAPPAADNVRNSAPQGAAMNN